MSGLDSNDTAAGNGLAAIPSATNFVTIDCGRDAAFARRVLEALLARDVFVRKPMAPVLERCIRVSVGRDEELDIFAEELPAALSAASTSPFVMVPPLPVPVIAAGSRSFSIASAKAGSVIARSE